MKSFTTQQGYPVVRIARCVEASGSPNHTQLMVSQKEFQLINNRGTVSTKLWNVPLQISIFSKCDDDTASSPVEPISTVFSEREARIDLPVELKKSKDVYFVKANPGHCGFYRCVYDEVMFNEIIDNFSSLPEADRQGFQNDVFALFQAGEYTVEQVMQLFDAVTADSSCQVSDSLKNRKKETSYAVLNDFAGNVNDFIDALVDDDDDEKEEGGKCRRALQKKAFKGSFDNAMQFIKRVESGEQKTKFSPEERLLRPLYLRGAIKYAKAVSEESKEESPSSSSGAEEQELIKQLHHYAAKIAKSYLQPKTFAVVDHDMLKDGLVAAISTARLEDIEEVFGKDIDIFALVLDTLKKVGDYDADATRRLVWVLCSHPDQARVEQVAKMCIDSNGIRSQFGNTVTMSLSRNSAYSHHLWPFFKANIDNIDALWGSGQFRIQNIVENVGGTLHGEESANDFHNFFQNVHPLPNAALSIKRAVEGIKMRACLRKEYGATLKRLLLHR